MLWFPLEIKKPLGGPKSYRPISWLCVHFKIFQFIYTCIEPIIELEPEKQTGFQHKKSIVDQVTLLTQKIEDSFLAKKKDSAGFVNLTAVYIIVWHCGLTCKLLCLLNRHMDSLIMELFHNPSFTLTTGVGKQNRLQCFKNGVPHESVLTHLLFGIYT